MHEEVIQPLPANVVDLRDETLIDDMARIVAELRGAPTWIGATAGTDVAEEERRVVLPVGEVDHLGWEFHTGDTVLRATAIRDGWMVASVVTPGHPPVVIAIPTAA